MVDSTKVGPKESWQIKANKTAVFVDDVECQELASPLPFLSQRPEGQ